MMSLHSLISYYRKNSMFPLLGGVLCAFLGAVVFYLYPAKHIATGSFYISRSLETVPSEFKYEGYYASLSSEGFASTLIALIESDDIRSQVLEKIHRPVTRSSLRSLKRVVSAKNSSTPLVALQVKSASPEDARLLWTTYSSVLQEASQTLNKNGDSKLTLTPVSAQPVVYRGFSSLPLNAVLGFILGFFGVLFIQGLYFYMKGGDHELI